MNKHTHRLVILAVSMLVVLSVISSNTFAQNSTEQKRPAEADAAAIRQAALDYIEGWYEGNSERMERALHPELAKRIVRTDAKTGRSSLGQMSAMSLVLGTRNGGGKATPKEKQQKDVTILDVFENAACAKVVASDWIDYLQLAKWNGRWVIVNVLWELKPETR